MRGSAAETKNFNHIYSHYEYRINGVLTFILTRRNFQRNKTIVSQCSNFYFTLKLMNHSKIKIKNILTKDKKKHQCLIFFIY